MLQEILMVLSQKHFLFICNHWMEQTRSCHLECWKFGILLALPSNLLDAPREVILTVTTAKKLGKWHNFIKGWAVSKSINLILIFKTLLIFFVVLVWMLNQILTFFLHCPLFHDKRITLLSTLNKLDSNSLFHLEKISFILMHSFYLLKDSKNPYFNVL